MAKEIDFLKTAILLVIGYIGGYALGSFLPWVGIFPELQWSPILGVLLALFLGFKQFFE